MKTCLCGTIRLPGSCGAERDFREKYGKMDADNIVCNEPLIDNSGDPQFKGQNYFCLSL